MELIKFKSIGADPEFFVKRGDEFLPSTMFLVGTKEEPEDMGNGFSLLKDNLSLEGNIPASFSRSQFINNIKFLKMLIDTATPDDVEIVYTDEAKFKRKYLFSPDGMLFGCSNYKDAWERKIVPTPVLANMNTRQIGFHIHIGYDVLSNKYSKDEYNVAITRAFDAFISKPSDEVHYSKNRRNYYGKLGSYRDKPYGVECRSLGGYFTQDKYLGWIYDQVEAILEYVDENIDYILEVDSIDDLMKVKPKKFVKIPE